MIVEIALPACIGSIAVEDDGGNRCIYLDRESARQSNLCFMPCIKSIFGVTHPTVGRDHNGGKARTSVV